MKKIILDLCGGTGSWAKPYKDAGYDVMTITLCPVKVLAILTLLLFVLEQWKRM